MRRTAGRGLWGTGVAPVPAGADSKPAVPPLWEEGERLWHPFRGWGTVTEPRCVKYPGTSLCRVLFEEKQADQSNPNGNAVFDSSMKRDEDTKTREPVRPVRNKVASKTST